MVVLVIIRRTVSKIFCRGLGGALGDERRARHEFAAIEGTVRSVRVPG